MKYLITCILPVLLLLSCHHSPVQYMNGSVEDVFARAQKENKNVFIIIGNSKCGNCDAFRKMLDSQSTTARILQRDYICYNADASDKRQEDIARITKCPSYPFPYFFDKDGNLLTFGFPKSKEYDIRDLDRIGIDEYIFREIFQLPITTQRYKKLVSLNMQAFLLMKGGGGRPSARDSAYQLARRSLDIAAYPYNIYLSHTLGGPAAVAQLVRPVYSPSDKLIYKGLLDTIPLQENSLARQQGATDSASLVFNKISHDCGIIKQGTDYTFSFEFTNTGKKDLRIAKADHPCTCIELKWPQHARKVFNPSS
ncbi:DUF1573 domain-containing protein [uncultured Chitinophaga sp.]|jgi:Highly conserved protein containing a thioredoxin domain|uniref:DUF1573 domain-containing protein n=1 Tax=uncultured Chitinophaga sp. TaxID=339340 RepID=UPI00260E66E9|nr:DUF1573 domain-containing protein [uncultured Chitinophaga sp.]